MSEKISPEPSYSTVFPKVLSNIVFRFWPELSEQSGERQLLGIGEVFSTFYSLPFLIFGITWLIISSDFGWLMSHLLEIFLFTLLIVIFNQLGFFLIIEYRKNRYGSTDGALTGIPIWAGVLIFGPTIFWFPVLWSLYQFFINLRKTRSKTARWGLVRNLSMNVTCESFISLIAFNVYRSIGGMTPIDGLSVNTIILTLGLFGSFFIAYSCFWAPYIGYHVWAQQKITKNKEVSPIVGFFFLAVGLPQLANPFASLAAGLYVQSGEIIFIYFMIGMILVAYLARRLSWSAEQSRQSSRLLEKLEILSRSIINTPPDEENLPQLLQQHLTNMFPSGRLVVWIFPEEILTQHPLEWTPTLDKFMPWLLDRSQGDIFLPNENLPWNDKKTDHNPTIIHPIIEMESSQVIGGIYLDFHTLVQPWDRKSLLNLYPAVQALSAQIASALNQTKSYQQVIEYNKMSEQLKLAGDIQASLLPFSFPDMPGWQLAVTLDPVGETSGDFFDIIPLDENRIGFLIADVLDKGFGPALYMTLSRTLIRTYATEFDLQPDLVFFATNERILRDTRANLFVTVFFGVVDLTTGEMTYSNAGHNPPYLIASQNEKEPFALDTTGFPIGVDDDATWTRETVEIHPGDTLILYTDGVPDAQNPEGEFYKQKSLVKVATENFGQSAEVVQKSILDSVYDFVSDAQPFDDITLMILIRDKENNKYGGE